ncbi:class I SAM-dependent RNA methyltransferase [Isoptericola variabilis]|uniref:Deoxyribonuclease/rho motif-related TRAM n=1 Tax=Isoptericola variabilis (strain 225) TaxID=743718 RepID=F6FWE9_ISOV2|nr:deoxyribonuclease/rho motif-related TRAM [Isoptericola variabilis 225]TWH26561.1 tRNA/tmRNA/rRNA uracil-C5-methylase (TrmA/RlmC/RlmD family) [Isoptericola variabilis J7]
MPRPRRSSPRPRPSTPDPEAGRELELEVGPAAHGGHCVARLDGRVVFVRHALPGERVRARVTESGSRFWRADAVEVLEASPDRVESAWPEAGPGGVGGGELAHVSLPGQRRWKADVLADQLRRIAHVERTVAVEAAPGDDERGGLAYRTRVELVADGEGRAGMRRFRSHDVVALDRMPLATEAVAALAEAEGVWTRRWRPGARLELVAPADGSAPVLLLDGAPVRRGTPDTRPNARRAVTETVRAGGVEHRYRVAADGFWQVHREAPGVLAGAVLDAVLGQSGDVAGATVLDLYSGAGLFTLPLAHAVGPDGRVVAVEGDARAVKDARRNAHDLPHVELHLGAVDRVLTDGDAGGAGVGAADVVVLDPPRAGAGRTVVDAIADRAPSRVVYVACDPAALARDVGYLGERGYELASLRGFDLFPMTHHVEAVAVLTR